MSKRKEFNPFPNAPIINKMKSSRHSGGNASAHMSSSGSAPSTRSGSGKGQSNGISAGSASTVDRRRSR